MPDLMIEMTALADPLQLPGDQLTSDRSDGQVGAALADTIAAAIAASREPVCAILAGLPAPAGPASCWLGGGTVDPRSAALRNGTAAHALDYDDVSHQVKGHPSTVLFPALTALLDESRASTGRDLIEAYLAGYYAQALLAGAVGVGAHYRDGWHPTATLGVVGATVAGARLIGLPARMVSNAIGIAATTASGLRVNFGSMTKPLHAGLAAANAVQALQLAQAGLTAAADAFSGRDGLLQVFRRDRPSSPTAVTFDGVPRTNIKKYPCCYQLQRAADAALALRPQVGERGGLESVRQIAVTVEANGAGALEHPRPRTGLEAKFSAPFVIETMLSEGHLSLRQFTDAGVNAWSERPDHPKVTLQEAECPPYGPSEWTDGYAVVVIQTYDGETLEARVDVPHGDYRSPLSLSELTAKYADCARHGIGAEQVCEQDLGAAVSLLRGIAAEPDARAAIARALELTNPHAEVMA